MSTDTTKPETYEKSVTEPTEENENNLGYLDTKPQIRIEEENMFLHAEEPTAVDCAWKILLLRYTKCSQNVLNTHLLQKNKQKEVNNT